MTDYEKKNHKTFLRDVAKKKKKILVKCPERPKYSNYVANKWGKSKKLHAMFSDWRINDQLPTCELSDVCVCCVIDCSVVSDPL